MQGGTASAAKTDTLVSLASLYFEPLWVFSRTAPARPTCASCAASAWPIGPEGSGTRAVALTLLAGNGITDATAQLLPTTGTDAVKALRAGTVDTVFLIAGPSSPAVKDMLHTPGIELLGFPAGRRLHQALSLPQQARVCPPAA